MMELFTKKLNNRKGFTLIELIVVIAIIGILAAILIPQFGGFTDKAKATQAVVDAKQVATAFDSLQAETSNAKGDYTGITTTQVASMSGISSGFTLQNDGGLAYTMSPGGFTAGRDSYTEPIKRTN